MRPIHAVLLPLLALAGPAGAASLCAPGEPVAFTCPAGAHVISVCGLPGGSLQYRYGRPGHVDLAYPAAGTPAAQAFSAGLLAYSGGGGAYLAFANGAYGYTVFTAIGKWGRNGEAYPLAGVAVTKADAEVADIACDHHDAETSELGADFFDRYHIPTADPGTGDFDIPDAFMPN